MDVYEVRPRKSHRGIDLTSYALSFGRLPADCRYNQRSSSEYARPLLNMAGVIQRMNRELYAIRTIADKIQREVSR